MSGAFPAPECFSVAVEGAILAGEQRGERPRLVFVHGMAGERHDWDRLLACLPADIPYLRYDLRGFGRSTAKPGVRFSHADDLLAVLDARGIASAALVGVSMGGAIALSFALSHPERVSRLVLISPWLTGWEASAEWKALWREVAEAAHARDLALARERWFLHPMFAALRENAELAAELRRALKCYHGRQWTRDDQREELPGLERLHTLSAPTLLLTGGRDLPDLRLIAQLIEAAAPDVRRIEWPDAGHALHLERSADVAQAIGESVEEH